MTDPNTLEDPELVKDATRLEQVAPEHDIMTDILSDLQENSATIHTFAHGITALVPLSSGFAVGLKNGEIAVNDGNETRYVSCSGDHHQISCLAVSHDGQLLLCGCKNSVYVYSLPTGVLVTELAGHTKWLHCVTSTSQYILSGAFDHTIRVYNSSDFSLETVLEGHLGEIECILPFKSSGMLISGAWDSLIKIWSMKDWRELCTLTGHGKCIDCLALIRFKKQLVSAASDGIIKVWNLNNYAEIATLRGHSQGAIRGLEVTRSGLYIVSGSVDRTVKVWSAESFTLLNSVTVHATADPKSLLLSQNDRYIFTTCECAVQVYTVEKLEEVATILGHVKPVKELGLSGNGGKLMSAGMDNVVREWELDYQGGANKVYGHPQVVSTFVETLDGIATITSKAIRLWQFSTQRQIHQLEGHTKTIDCMAISYDRKLLVTGAKDKTIRVWDIPTRTCVATLTGHIAKITAVAISQDMKWVVSSSFENVIIVWSLREMREIERLKGHTAVVTCLCVTPDGDTLVSAGKDNTVKFWSLRDFSVLISHSTALTRCMSITPNGKFLVTGGRDKNVFLWDLGEKRIVSNWAGHSDGVWSVAVSSDSRFVVSGSLDATVRLWSLPDRREMACFRHHTQHVTCVSFTSDNRHIISSSWDKSVTYTEISQYTQSPAPGSVLFSANVLKFRFNKQVHRDVFPYRIPKHNMNCLHISAYFSRAAGLATALQAGTLLLRGTLGSPLTVALNRSANRCLDVILEYLTSGPENDENWLQFSSISDDLPQVLHRNSSYVVPLFQRLFCLSAQPFLPSFITPIRPIPFIDFQPTRQFFIRDIAKYAGMEMVKISNLRVEFWISLLRWNFCPGSYQSLSFLQALKRSNHYDKLLSTPFMEVLLEAKWNELYLFALGLTVLYGLMMVTLIALVFLYWDVTVLSIFFFILNSLLLIYEILQIVGGQKAYLTDPWNAIDLTRGILCLSWSVCLFSDINPQGLRLVVVILCFLRGFTYFRTFNPTRVFVNLALSVTRQIYAFLVLLAYCVFGFGVTASIMSDDDSATQSWTSAFNILLGSFETGSFGLIQWVIFVACNLVNVIVMLNLLISIIGDAYDRAQVSLAEYDRHEKLQVVMEFEAVMFWKRRSGSETVMVKCKVKKESAGGDEWMGRVNALLQAFKTEHSELSSTLTSHQNRSFELLTHQVSALETRMCGIEGKLDLLLQSTPSNMQKQGK